LVIFVTFVIFVPEREPSAVAAQAIAYEVEDPDADVDGPRADAPGTKITKITKITNNQYGL
jgi:hypothetical protein